MNEQKSAETDETLGLSLIRASLYRFLAEAFRYPAPGAQERLRAFMPAPETMPLTEDSAVAAMDGVRRWLDGADDAALESAWIDAFGHTLPEAYPPIETRYGSTHAFQESQDLADVTAFYDAFGLRPKPGRGERADHVGVELDFVYFLALQEAYALEKSDAEGAERSRATSRSFLEDHLARWGPVFGSLLARKGTHPLYRDLGTLLVAVLRADIAGLGLTPRPVSPEPVPLPPEPTPEEMEAIEAAALERGPGG